MFAILVGGGKVGVYLGASLIEGGHRVTIVEERSERAAQISKELPEQTVITGNGTNPALLEKAGILKADVIAAVTGKDETNLVVTNLARHEFNVPRTVARVNNPKNAWMFTEQMGVDVSLNQAELMAHLIIEEMSLGNMLTLLKLQRGTYSLVEEAIENQAIADGKLIQALSLPEKCVLTAIMRNDNLIIPRGNVQLAAGDVVIALVHEEQIPMLKSLLGHSN